MIVELSQSQARKLVLHSQGLPPKAAKGGALEATLAALTNINYVQIDTISVIQRAHHHTLWNRNPRYKTTHIDKLLEDKSLFEYWSHAAAYLPMRDFRFSLPRKMAIKSQQQDHWYERDHKRMKAIFDKIRIEGPMMAKDFDAGGEKTGEWHSKPAKRALEYLFMQGDLMVGRRHNFHKVYDLTERVLPSTVDTCTPNPQEYHDHLIKRFLAANGLGTEKEMRYLLKNMAGKLKPRLDELTEHGDLIQCKVGSVQYYALPASLQLLNRPLNRQQLKILSPFDNLLIQRKRMQQLFQFDYQIECYVPAKKRQHGYFCLPLLWNGNLLGRLDCKAHRDTKVLQIHSLHLDNTPKKLDHFCEALLKELKQFTRFNGCNQIDVKGIRGFKLDNTPLASLSAEYPV